MSILFVTQGMSLEAMFNLQKELGRRLDLGRVGYYVTDSFHFENFVRKNPDFPGQSPDILKEWEITKGALETPLDPRFIEEAEKKYGETLWNAITCDRRLCLGKNHPFFQDYKSRYSHEHLLKIMQNGIRHIESHLEKIRPDLVFSYLCVTFGEYLYWATCKKMGIPFFNMRPAKLENLQIIDSDIHDPPQSVSREFQHLAESGIDPSLLKTAEKILKRNAGPDAFHDGMVSPSKRTIARLWKIRPGSFKPFLANQRRYLSRNRRFDTHAISPVRHFFYRKILTPVRSKIHGHYVRRFYTPPDRLKTESFAFYPMHTEPEIALSLYGRPFANQIEVIRFIAMSLPAHMKLVLKEHPAGLGRRSFGYYQKLMRIPNVMMVDSFIDAADVIRHSRMIITITSNVGQEAIFLKRPVICLGRTKYEVLPITMVRRVADMTVLASNIRELLENYHYDEKALLCYVSAIVKSSVPINWVTNALKKFYSLRLESGGLGQNPDAGRDMVLLADHLEKILSPTKEMPRQYAAH